MSSLWTPGGERPVGREPESPPGPQPPPGPQQPQRGGRPSDEELEAELAEVQRQIAEAPAWAVIANHTIGMFQLAGVHLSQAPPNLDEAALAIDAMAALVEGLAGRLGPEEPTLKDALAQIRLAFVQIRAAAGESGPESPESGKAPTLSLIHI